METKLSNQDRSVHLKRSIGLTTGCSVIISYIIGSGIFITPQGVLIGAGSYGLSLIIWAVCGLLSMCGALSFAEIGTLIPKSGSSYYYLKEVYGDCVGFTYMFASVFAMFPAASAAVSLTCSEYLMALFFSDGCGAAPDSIRKTLATMFLLLTVVINARSVILSGQLAVFFSAAKVSALVIIIIGGFIMLAKGSTDYLHPDNSFDGTTADAGGIAAAITNGMFAFSGWDALTLITEELKQPGRNLPLSVFISVPFVTIIYILTNVSYFSVIPPDEVKASAAVAFTWAEYVIPQVLWFVPLAVAMSTFGNSCSNQLANARLLYVAGRERHLPKVLSMVQVHNFTPAPAVILFGVFSILFIYMGTIGELIAFVGILGWFFNGLVGIAVLILRVTKKDAIRDYKAPLICIIIFTGFSFFLFLGPIISNPQWGNIFAVVILILSTILWLVMVNWTINIPGIDNVTKALQLFLQIVPIEEPSMTIYVNKDFDDSNAQYSQITKF